MHGFAVVPGERGTGTHICYTRFQRCHGAYRVKAYERVKVVLQFHFWRDYADIL